MVNFLNEANNIKDELIKIRRDIHENPEIGFELYRTSKLVKDYLKSLGIPYYATAKTGVCGIIKGEKSGNNKVIALRADMDALPIEEKNMFSYKSKIKGKMHACGHDGHTAILLGVSKILNKYKSDFSGTVKLLFEPAEETEGGAPIMIKEGVLDDPKVDYIVGLHVTEELECGKIMIKNGVTHAASNPFKIRIIGSGGHGAHPNDTVDPIIISANVINAIQTIISREISPLNSALITVGSIHSGTASNIIPDEAYLTGIIRTMSKDDRDFVKIRLKEVVKGICNSLNAQCEIIIEEGYPCLYNDDEVVEMIKNSAVKILGGNHVVRQRDPSMGVESFAYFAKERPSAFYFLGTKNKVKNTDKPAHSSCFDIDEDALPLGVSVQCDIAYEYLTRS